MTLLSPSTLSSNPDCKAVLFDLDGTLADTALDLGAAANALRVARGLPPLDLSFFRCYASHGAPRLIQAALSIAATHPEFELCKNHFLDHYEANVCTYSQWFEGIPELIQELETAGIRWGIVTNKNARFGEPLLAKLQPLLNAGCIIYGDTTAHPKPHPAPLLEAAKQLGCQPEQCWYVGDAERDIIAAHAAGMHSIVAAYGYIGKEDRPESWGGHHLCSSVSQLQQLIRTAYPY